MGKTLVINLEDVNIQGDILDVGENNLGIIYNISKEVLEEISIDYVNEETKCKLQSRKYDACTFFFDLNKMWTSLEKERLIKNVSKYLKNNGEIQKILEKYFEIEETKVYEDVFFIRGKKLTLKEEVEENTINENITYSY